MADNELVCIQCGVNTARVFNKTFHPPFPPPPPPLPPPLCCFSVVVKVGPRDFWSQRMSEYTGKSHRLVFDETLERIYSTIYQDHVAMS